MSQRRCKRQGKAAAGLSQLQVLCFWHTYLFCVVLNPMASACKNGAKKAASATPSAFSHLLSPLNLGAAGTLRNRVVMGSMHTGLEDFGVVKSLMRGSTRGGLSELASFFGARAEGGVGLIVTGGIAPNRAGKVSPLAGKMSNGLEAAAHAEVADAVHTHGGKIAMQILHAGRYAYHPWSVAPSAIRAPIAWFAPRALATQGSLATRFANPWGTVESTIDDFVRSAVLARTAGYDGVEVMGSEGYLINQFLVAKTNKRADKWGGEYERRMQLPVEIVRRMRAAVGASSQRHRQLE